MISGIGRAASTVGQVASYAQQAWDFAQSAARGVQQAQQFAASLGLGRARPAQPQPEPPPSAPPTAPSPDAGAQPQPEPAPQPASAFDQVAALLSAMQQRQIPALPPAQAPPASAPAAVPAQMDALGLLRTILSNPQLQQALQPAAPAVSRTVQLPVATNAVTGQTRDVHVPIGAVLNAIAALSGRAMTELGEQIGEDEPDIPAYLVGDDGNFLVDPASADDRAALVTHLFRLAEATERMAHPIDDAEAFAVALGIS